MVPDSTGAIWQELRTNFDFPISSFDFPVSDFPLLQLPFSQLPTKRGASVESCAGHSVFGIVLVVLTKVPLLPLLQVSDSTDHRASPHSEGARTRNRGQERRDWRVQVGAGRTFE